MPLVERELGGYHRYGLGGFESSCQKEARSGFRSSDGLKGHVLVDTTRSRIVGGIFRGARIVRYRVICRRKAIRPFVFRTASRCVRGVLVWDVLSYVIRFFFGFSICDGARRVLRGLGLCSISATCQKVRR